MTTELQEQALSVGLHPLVVSYLSMPLALQSPVGLRAWQRASNLITLNPDGDLRAMLEPMIGPINAVGICELIHLNQVLPDVEEVLEGRVTKIPALDPSTVYALICTIGYALKDEHDDWINTPTDHKQSRYHYKDGSIRAEYQVWLRRADHATRFVMDNLEPEMAIMFARTCIQVFRLPFHMSRMPAFSDFAQKYRHLVMA